MKNKIYTLAIAMFTIILMLTSIDIIVFNKGFFHNQYLKLDTAKSMDMSNDDLDKATSVLLDYIKGKKDSIDVEVVVKGEVVEMFNQREKDHMVDVRNLYLRMLDVRRSLMIIVAMVTMVALGLFDFVNFRQSARNVEDSFKGVLLVVGALGFYAILDFNSFWTMFHEILFSNDLWLLDPQTDRMINMFPEPFFKAMVMRIIVAFLVIMALKYVTIKIFDYIADRKELV
jgi:integral membrane protein (TIGR01906 family)